MKMERMIDMSIKKTVISVVSGAIAGGMIASVMTLSIAGNINKDYLCF